MNEPWAWIVAALAAWGALVLLAWWLDSSPIRQGDLAGQVAYRLMQAYARLLHRLRVEDRVNIPRPPWDAADPSRPLIVVANHTAGVDPLLVQTALPFEPRWMMGADMRAPSAQWFWDLSRVIFVDRFNGGSQGLREALRHLAGKGGTGGVLGIFPEGHIERPPGVILPFQEGVGMLIKKSRALVLPVLITGTPQIDPAWASLWKPSRSTVRILPLMDYAATGLGPREIADDLRRHFISASGWPAGERVPRMVNGSLRLIDLEGREFTAPRTAEAASSPSRSA